ncbi:MAG: peptide chain release factor N(5)-glutamine methyltransferase [Bacteroidota bacterium]
MENGKILVKNLVSEFSSKLSGTYGEEEIRQIIYMLFGEYMGWPKTMIHLSWDEQLPADVQAMFAGALAELCNGKPVQYILGKTWFNGWLLRVDSRVLIPRPETEELCEIIGAVAGSLKHPISILDIGTGSGCIPVDLKKRLPDSHITAIDISSGALVVALENAFDNHCEITFLKADILNGDDRQKLGVFNLIVSNPPYVPEGEKVMMNRNVADFEPALALFVPDDDPLRYYRAITAFSSGHLTRPGYLFFEIHERFGQQISDMVNVSGFSEVEVLRDIHGKERFIKAVLKSPSTPGS